MIWGSGPAMHCPSLAQMALSTPRLSVPLHHPQDQGHQHRPHRRPSVSGCSFGPKDATRPSCTLDAIRGGGDDERRPQLYLITDRGFAPRALLFLVLFSSVLLTPLPGGGSGRGRLSQYVASMVLNRGAEGATGWVLLGMASSSCCIIQV